MPTADGKIRWGILGTAKIARTALIPAIQQSRHGRVLALASRDLAKGRAWAEEQGILRVHPSYADLLADPEIDAVYLPLPTGLHAEWCLRCAEAGKPALCEKPFAANAAQAETVGEAFAARGLPVAEALMYLFHPLTRQALALLHEGAIGPVRTIRASFSANIEPGNIRLDPALAGGALLDLGVYCVSFLRQVAGQEPAAIRAVAHWDPTGRLDQSLAGLLRFPNGILGHFSSTLLGQFDCSYDVIGAQGRLLVDWGALVAWPGSPFKIRLWQGDRYEEQEVAPANHYALMVDDFAEALLDRRPPRYPLSETIANLRVLDALRAAALD